MILLVHKDEVVTEVIDLETTQPILTNVKKPINVLFYIANNYKEHILIWCHKSLKSSLNFEEIRKAFHLKNTMLSYSKNQYLPEQIGYVEDASPFLKINKNVTYPTWLMSSQVGAIHTSQLLKFENKIPLKDTFSFSLNSIAKIGVTNGLFCYSEPKMLKINDIINEHEASVYKLFKFVRLHYKRVWSILLLVNFIVNERKFPFLSFFGTFFMKRFSPSISFDLEQIESSTKEAEHTTDVIIPTLGRKEHIHNFLIDLSNQSLLPNRVIIIEQNENVKSKSELDFITNKTWPFKIIHEFIYQTGACNARNIGLKHLDSNYIFLADDDIRIHSDFIETVLKTMSNLKLPAVTLSCLTKNSKKEFNKAMQWTSFGSGCSFVKKDHLKNASFDMKYEHGYGEDIDFGMQLRNNGTDIIYLPKPEILHLKAPIGGFRTKFVHDWEKENILPKPSPTVMLNRRKNTTQKQLLGYRIKLFIQFYKKQEIRNPFKYLNRFKKQWRQSEVWANFLKEKRI